MEQIRTGDRTVSIAAARLEGECPWATPRELEALAAATPASPAATGHPEPAESRAA